MRDNIIKYCEFALERQRILHRFGLSDKDLCDIECKIHEWLQGASQLESNAALLFDTFWVAVNKSLEDSEDE